MEPNKNTHMQLLTLHEVMEITKLSRSTIYSWVAQGRFPENVSVGSRTVRWVRHEIEDWLTSKVEASRNL